MLEVIFPAGVAVTAYAGVFVARTENVYDKEFQRVKAGFKRTKQGGVFDINGPLVGFRYLIYWTLPRSGTS